MFSANFFMDGNEALFGDIVIKKAKENIRNFFNLNEGYFKEIGPLKIENNIVFLSGHDKDGIESEEFGIPKYLEKDIVKEKKIRLIIDKSTIKFFDVLNKEEADKYTELNTIYMMKHITSPEQKNISFLHFIGDLIRLLAIIDKYDNVKEIYFNYINSKENLELEFLVQFFENLSKINSHENIFNETAKNFSDFKDLFNELNFNKYKFKINNDRFPLKKEKDIFEKHFYLNVSRKS